MDYTTTTYINFYVNYPVSVKVAQMAVLNKTGKIKEV